jgi:hypothetical protein
MTTTALGITVGVFALSTGSLCSAYRGPGGVALETNRRLAHRGARHLPATPPEQKGRRHGA